MSQIPWTPSVEEVMDLIRCGVNTIPEMCMYLHPDMKDYVRSWYRAKIYHRLSCLEKYRMVRRAGYCLMHGSKTAVWEVCE